MRTSMRKDDGALSADYDSSSNGKVDLEKDDRQRKVSGYDDRRSDPFGDEDAQEGGTKYRTLAWWQASMIMIAETISLGILSLPSVLATIGLVGGIILILGLGILATYTGYVIGQFKWAYPYVHSMADAGEVLFSPLARRYNMPVIASIGKEFFGAAQTIFLIFSMASHILTWTIGLDTISVHATCTIVWAVVGLIIFYIFTIPRTLKKVSWLSITSFISIVAAVLITMIALGISPAGRGTQATEKAAFADAFLSVTNIIFAYAGHVAFFSFISELRDPKEFPKALWLLQICDTGFYIVAAIVIYRYAGADVSSPALGSASDTVAKVAYGIAIPTIIIAGVIYGHVATKYVFVRVFRGTEHLHARTWYSYLVWGSIAATCWILAFIIAESIPVFNDLLSLISALFASWFTYGLSGVFWLFLNYGQYTRNSKKILLTLLNIIIFCIGGVICGAGLYASGTAIQADSKSGHSWSCTPNPN